MLNLTLAFAVGLFAGFINVIVGSGSSIAVPFLIFLGLPPVIAIGTNRFAMMFNNFTGAIRYHAKQYLNLRVALIFALCAAAGSILGAKLVIITKPAILTDIIAAILILEALVLLFGAKLGLARRSIEFTQKHYIAGCLFGFLAGVYGGFIGMAITSIIMFFIVLFFGFSFLESAAMTKVITFAISFAATIVFLANLKVNIALGATLAVAYIIGGYLGVHSAVKMGDVRVRMLFIAVVTLGAVGLLVGWKV